VLIAAINISIAC